MIKYIKLGLLGIIGLFGLVGFSNATYQVFQVGLNRYNSNWNSQYDIGFLKKGRFLTTYLGTTKSLVALDNDFMFWRTPAGGLYTYGRGGGQQGYFQYIQSCDLIDGNGTGDYLQNCTDPQQITYLNNEIVANFINGLTTDDWVYVDYNSGNYGCGGNCHFTRYNFKVCFSSSSVGSTVCFVADKSSYETSEYYRTKYPVVGSLNYENLNFANINRADLSDPPLFDGSNNGNIEGSSGVGDNISLTGNLMYHSCTNGYIVSEVGKMYGGSSICYAGTYDTGLIENGSITYVPSEQGLTFKEVYQNTSDGTYGYYSSYANWWNSWNDTMYRFRMGTVDYHVWEGMPIYLYAYFSRLYDNGLVYNGQQEVYNVLNYCKLVLYSDYTAQYQGSYFSSYCDKFSSSSDGGTYVTTGQVGSVTNDNDLEVLPPNYNIGGGSNGGSNTSNGTIVGVDWSGTLSGDTNKNFEGKTFINDFYQKLQSNFQKPVQTATGIIPVYIYVFMIALILFRFLQH